MATSVPIPVLLMVRELGIGGCERDLAKLARWLDRSRFTPYVGCFYKEGLRAAEVHEAKVPIIEFPVRSFVSGSVLTGATMLWKFIKKEGIQVVQCFDTPTDIFGLPVARMAGVPAVIGSRLWNMEMTAPQYRRPARWSERFAHKMVVNARSVGAELEAEGVARERIYLCYNGVETSIFHPRKRGRIPPLENAELVVGTVCALRDTKRLDLLIDAFAAVRDARPGMKLVIVGGGPMEKAWKDRALNHQLGEQCHFEPACSDVTPWMRSIDIFVNPSDLEGFPNALLEAMACGCTVIGSRADGIPEMVGTAGQIFEKGNLADLIEKLKRALNSPEQRALWGEEAARRAKEEFSMQRTVQRMQHIYSYLVDPSGVPEPSGYDEHRETRPAEWDAQEQSTR